MNAMYSKSNSMLKLSTAIAAGRNLAFFFIKAAISRAGFCLSGWQNLNHIR